MGNRHRSFRQACYCLPYSAFESYRMIVNSHSVEYGRSFDSHVVINVFCAIKSYILSCCYISPCFSCKPSIGRSSLCRIAVSVVYFNVYPFCFCCGCCKIIVTVRIIGYLNGPFCFKRCIFAECSCCKVYCIAAVNPSNELVAFLNILRLYSSNSGALCCFNGINTVAV